MKTMNEFKPTVLFLVKFIGFYIAGNLLYGVYVTSFAPRPDPATHYVTAHTGVALRATGTPVEVKDDRRKPNTLIRHEGKSVLSVYEGCNGLNTMIIFAAFLFAFGPISRPLLWFVPLGLLIIHLANLARIAMLFYVALYRPEKMYFVHKYLFTAILYAVIFVLWIWWVNRYSPKK
jgi:exosortase family protein XrtF